MQNGACLPKPHFPLRFSLSYRNSNNPLEVKAGEGRHGAGATWRLRGALHCAALARPACGHRLFLWKRSEADTTTNPSSAGFPRAQSTEPGMCLFTAPITRGSHGDSWREPCPVSRKCSFDSTPLPTALCQLWRPPVEFKIHFEPLGPHTRFPPPCGTGGAPCWHGDRPKARCSARAVWVPGRRRGFSAPHGSLQNDAKQCPCQDPLRQRPQGTRQRPKDALGASISSKRYLFCPLRLPPAEAPVRAGRAGSCDPRETWLRPTAAAARGRSAHLLLLSLLSRSSSSSAELSRFAQSLQVAPPGDGRPGALAWEDDVWEDDVWEDDWDKARLGGRRKRQVQDSAQAVTTDNVTLSAHTKPFPGACTQAHA